MSDTTTPLNREGWLHAFAEAIAPELKTRANVNVPLSKVRLSCSFPRTRNTPNKKGKFALGVCMHADGMSSKLHEIHINPLRDDPMDIAATVTHELIHASLAAGVGHKAPFAKAAKLIGLEGKPTETEAGEDFKTLVRPILDELGPYPHKAFDANFGKKQSTRLLKVMCEDCGYVNEAGNGYTIRVTNTWVEVGLPICPCGATMVLQDGADVNVLSLKPVESHVTYQVPFKDEDGNPYGIDPRFQVRRNSSERLGDSWTVIDFGTDVLDSKPRIVSAEGKGHALDMIDAIREGLFTWDTLEDEHDGDEWDDDDGSNPLADDDEFLYVPEDEDEDPEHPEDQQPEPHVLRKRFNGQWREVPVTFEYDEVAASREG